MSAGLVWLIEAREEISAMAGKYVDWHLDPTAGVFTEYELAADEANRRNQAERRLLEEQLEQDYHARLGAWRTSVVQRQALAAAGVRTGPAFGLMKPQRGRYVHTDTYRVSQALPVHTRA